MFQGLCLERAPFYTHPMGSLPDRHELKSADFKTLQYGLSQTVEKNKINTVTEGYTKGMNPFIKNVDMVQIKISNFVLNNFSPHLAVSYQIACKLQH